ATDLTKIYPASTVPYSAGFQMPRWQWTLFYDSYVTPSQERTDPRISPLFADPMHFPKYVYVACGEADGLHEPAEKLLRKIKAARQGGEGEVIWNSVAGEAHGFDK